MPTIDHGSTDFVFNDGSRGRWSPSGPLLVVHVPLRRRRSAAPARAARRARDTVEVWGEGGLSGRVIVGLNVGDQPRHTVADVVGATRSILSEMGLKVDSTFIAQQGLYTEGTGRVVQENSVQILVFNESATPKNFEKQVTLLGRALRQRLDQDAVIIEIQERGVTQKLMQVKR